MTTDEAIQRNFRFQGRTRNLPWYPRKGTRNDLAPLFEKLGFNEGVEVGTFRGQWASFLCNANPKLHLNCVDPWMAYNGRSKEREDAYYDVAMKNLNGLNVTIIRKPSMEGVLQFQDGSVDFVYIDGNHLFDFAIMDIICWTPKVRKGGIIAVHDYHGQVGADVITAVNSYTHCHHIDPWYITREELPTAFWVQR